MNGSLVRFVISQPAAALYIQVPVFESTVAIQTIVKILYWNGAHGEPALGGICSGLSQFRTFVLFAGARAYDWLATRRSSPAFSWSSAAWRGAIA
jgi:hypothetical protein